MPVGIFGERIKSDLAEQFRPEKEFEFCLRLKACPVRARAFM